MKYIKRKINSFLRGAWVRWWAIKTIHKVSNPGVIYPFSEAPTLFVRWVAAFSDAEIMEASESEEMKSALFKYVLKARQESSIRRFRHWNAVKELE